MTGRRVAVVVGAAGVLTLFSGALPATADGSATASTSSEAWYRTADACEDGSVDCSLLSPPANFPENTLHVAATTGQTTAETYLELKRSDVPEDAEITGGTLTLPVDTKLSDGTLQPEAAKIVACPVEDFIDSSEGTFDEAPEYDCDSAMSPAQYEVGEQPRFTVDLAAFQMAWSEGTTPRLAIVPAPEVKESTDTWHVSFWGRKNETEGAQPITAVLTYETAEADDGGFVDSTPPDTPTVAPAPEPPAPEPIEDVAAQPQVDAPAPKAAEPAPDSAQAEPPPPVASADTRSYSYPYPIRWTMPLILLAGVIVTGRALTKQLGSPL